LTVCAVLVVASACSATRVQQVAPRTSESTGTASPVTATIPRAPSGVEVCETVDSTAGWPTTAAPARDAYTCIRDAFAAGTPAQMTSISGLGDTGRKGPDGYRVLTREIDTLRVLGKGKVRVITDTTEGGGTSTTVTCRGFEITSGGFLGTDCA
jgi:hypothetical protein